jgi:transcriptional regulator GlxA family with amidase domain
MGRKIGIVVFDGVEEMDFVGPWEVFTAATDNFKDDQVFLIAERLDPIICEKGMRVLPDVTFSDITELDLLLLPGGSGARREANNAIITAWLHRIAKTSRWVTSVCTGAFLLHAAGLANGRRITTHHDFIDDLRQEGANSVVSGMRVVQDGHIMTSGGVMSGIEMSLCLVEDLYGSKSAELVRNYIAYDKPPREALALSED